jgi:hypothetical protein
MKRTSRRFYPVLTELLDLTQEAVWDRRKAAYTLMVLAAQQFLQEAQPG